MFQTASPNNNSNTSNKKSTSIAARVFRHAKPAVTPLHDASEELENTSVCSSVSSLSDDEDHHGSGKGATSSSTPQRKKKSKFTITKTSPSSVSPATSVGVPSATETAASADAVSISFLSRPPLQDKQPAKQVIQRALTGLRPGGVFFVLDYKDDATPTNGASTSSSSPASKSAAVKELPEDLVQQWNLTMVPTNLETYYNNTKQSPTSKPVRPATYLPASKRIVRWMGVKPARQQNAPSNP